MRNRPHSANGHEKRYPHNSLPMQEASAQARQGYFSPVKPAGCYLLLWRGNRIDDPTLSYPHGIGGDPAVRITRIVVVGIAIVVDIAEVGRIGHGYR